MWCRDGEQWTRWQSRAQAVCAGLTTSVAAGWCRPVLTSGCGDVDPGNLIRTDSLCVV